MSVYYLFLKITNKIKINMDSLIVKSNNSEVINHVTNLNIYSCYSKDI